MKKLLVKVLLAIAVIGVVSSPYWSLDTYKNVEVTNTLVKGNDNLVYTDKTTFKVADTYAFLRMDSSDFYGKIKKGETYDITASGWRIGWFSIYENIISIEPSNSSK